MSCFRLLSKGAMALWTAFFLCAAQGQVYRCVDAAGRTLYTDAPCAPAARALPPEQLQANTLDSGYWRDRAQLPAAPAAPIPDASAALGPIVCPSELEIRNLETSASSQRLQQPERDFLWGELRRARACSREDSRYTVQDWRQLREIHALQTSSDPLAREAARRRAEAIHGSAASVQEQQRMALDRQIEVQRQAAGDVLLLRPPQRPQPPAQPACEGLVCTDARGQRYDRQPDGRWQRRQDQALCQEVRGQWRCEGGFTR